MVPQKTGPGLRSDSLTIPELEQSKAAVLNTLPSVHSRRSYTFAINRFIAWYCSEPRLTFNRAVVVRYRSHLEGLNLSASTINSHLSAIRRLADESAESGWLTPELAIGIRRVPGVKGLGRKIGNWLSRSQAQDLVNAASKTDMRGWRDGRNRHFYGCSRWPDCRATHGAHPDGKPMGVPADAETKKLRQGVHKQAERIWGKWDEIDKHQKNRMYDWFRQNTKSHHIAKMLAPELVETLAHLQQLTSFMSK